MNQGTVLWAGPDTLLPAQVWSELEAAGYTVTTAPDRSTALQLMAKRDPELVVTAQAQGNGSILEFVQRVRHEKPELPVIVIARTPTLEEAVEAMKLGAADYLPGSMAPGHLMARLTSVILRKRNDCRRSGSGKPGIVGKKRRFIGHDPATLKVLTLVRKVASSRATVLIEGESGTGKELIARQIHALSGRNGMAFVAVNCAALPEHLLESELFGHEKGAFTGAVSRKLGRFELAHRGTILLDEISEMAHALQAKLLRVLQEGEVDRLGSQQPLAIDARVLTTTNRNLQEMAAAGSFRQDLFYRLNVLRLVLPPLRERPGDILPLANYFLKKAAEMNDLPRKQFAPETEAALLEHQWPGNVRELENAIERAVLLSECEDIEPEDIFAAEECGTPQEAVSATHELNLKEMEERMIHAALDRHGGNRTHAARTLGISVRTLRNKLNEYKERAQAQG